MLPADADGTAYDWGVPGAGENGCDAAVAVVLMLCVEGLEVVVDIPYGAPMIPSPGSPPMVPHPPDAEEGWLCCSVGGDGSMSLLMRKHESHRLGSEPTAAPNENQEILGQLRLSLL